MSPVRILGTGSSAPERILTNFDLEKIVDTSDEWIRTRTGIAERRIADPDVATSDIAYEASLRALEAASVDAIDVDGIILGTVTPDYFFPSTACLLQSRLGQYSMSSGMHSPPFCQSFWWMVQLARRVKICQ